MSEKALIVLVITNLMVIALFYVKMILIHRDVQIEIHNRLLSDWSEVNKLYLQVVANCNESPIKNVTYKQMHERISHYFKHEYNK